MSATEKDARIQELEQRCAEQEATIHSQQNTIDALQKTNELLTDQLEEMSKQLHSSNQQFLSSRGLSGTDIVSNTPTDLDDSLNASTSRKDSLLSQCSVTADNSNNNNNPAAAMNQTQSIRADEDDIYSSGDDIETYKTTIDDDHELLPLKQGMLRKKSENMHRYNARYVVLYPSFLLYYDSCPIKTADTRRRSSTLAWGKKTNRNADPNLEINHPKGTIYLRNYHVAIRKDQKKQRFDITFVPHVSAIAMGLAAEGVRIRFRCKNVAELTDWTEKIRTAITSYNTGFIKYDVNTDFINNENFISNTTTASNVSNINSSVGGDRSHPAEKSAENADDDDDVDREEETQNVSETKENIDSDRELKDDTAIDEDVNVRGDTVSDEPCSTAPAPVPSSASTHTRMFDVNDLRQLMAQEQALKNELQVAHRCIATLEHETAQLVTDLAMKSNEVEQTQSIAQREKENLEARMIEVESHESALKDEIAELRQSMARMEERHREQHKKLKRYKYNEDDMERSICIVMEWMQKVKQNSLQSLGRVHSNKQLFEQCHRGCVALLEETYESLQYCGGGGSKHEHEHEEDEQDSLQLHSSFSVDDVKQQMEHHVSNGDGDNGSGKRKVKRKKQSKLSKQVMQFFTEIIQTQLKTVINFASLQQAHNGLVEEMKELKEQLAEYAENDENSLADDALIMASMTASLF